MLICLFVGFGFLRLNLILSHFFERLFGLLHFQEKLFLQMINGPIALTKSNEVTDLVGVI